MITASSSILHRFDGRSAIATLAAWPMAAIRVNEIELIEHHGIRQARVVRHRIADVPMRIANAIMRRRRVPVRMLGLEAWAAREAEMAQRTGDSALLRGGAIQRPWSPGTTLGVLLQQPSRALPPKLAACEAAARALRRLHDWDRGRISHGDATVWNVSYHDETGRASWFDFDLAHEDASPRIARHVDDLRAFVFSAAVVLDEVNLLQALQRIAGGYGDRVLWGELARLNRQELSRDPVHLAQAWGCRRRRERCLELLGRAFDVLD